MKNLLNQILLKKISSFPHIKKNAAFIFDLDINYLSSECTEENLLFNFTKEDLNM